MDYKALTNMYKTECACCGVTITLSWHEWNYRTGYELCKKCQKEYGNLNHVEVV